MKGRQRVIPHRSWQWYVYTAGFDDDGRGNEAKAPRNTVLEAGGTDGKGQGRIISRDLGQSEAKSLFFF